MREHIKAFDLHSKLEELHRLRATVQKFFDRLKLKEELVNIIVLSIDEAISNIIEHGYGLSSEGRIHLEIKIAGNKITIKIQDRTKRFDPRKVPKASVLDRVKERKQRGLGLIIIRKCMDNIFYRYTEDNKNELVMVKYIK